MYVRYLRKHTNSLNGCRGSASSGMVGNIHFLHEHPRCNKQIGAQVVNNACSYYLPATPGVSATEAITPGVIASNARCATPGHRSHWGNKNRNFSQKSSIVSTLPLRKALSPTGNISRNLEKHPLLPHQGWHLTRFSIKQRGIITLQVLTIERNHEFSPDYLTTCKQSPRKTSIHMRSATR